ncbi:MAG: mechanosensitive ion channel domain-containing protein [Candidatus Nanopelagicales bacterium]
MTESVEGVLLPVAAVLAAIVLGWLAAAVLRRLILILARRWDLVDILRFGIAWPLRLLMVCIAIRIALGLTTEPATWTAIAYHVLLILVVLSGAWLLIQFIQVVRRGILDRFPTEGGDNRHASRIHTQVQIIERLATAIVVVVAAAVILFTFPAMRAVGASVLASAGLAAVVAGVAAQSTLSNVFAGMQVAFADAIRVDDVVVVEEEWGRIEEITLTYVVVHLWDDRRLVLPSTYFTETPFENWTRTTSKMLGTVELDLDWTVAMEDLREEMDRLLRETDLWDGRVGVVQITDATGGTIRVRALASAISAPIVWDLRCYLREGLVTWLQQAGTGLPRSRFEAVGGGLAEPTLPHDAAPTERTRRPPRDATQPGTAPSAHETGLFTGTVAAVQRSQPFAGPSPEVLEERHRAAERGRAEAGDPEVRGGSPLSPPPARPSKRR